jgi:GT2 family glycosyltransferase
MIYDIIPYSTEKNLGKAYNDAIAALPDDAHICLRDGDTCWLTPDYGVHLAEYVRLHPNAVLTCWTNRINEKAEQQHKGTSISCPFGSNAPIEMKVRDVANIVDHLRAADTIKKDLYKTTALHGFVSGFCLVFPKSLWQQHKFAEKQVYEDRGPHNLLGVDNDWTNRVRAAGVPVLRMDGLYIWHTYRLLDNSKNHLM